MKQGKSLLVIGPTGVGKSSLLREALKHFGSGAVALAPGMDEANSYHSLLDDPAYSFEGFDDDEFYPTLGEKNATGLAKVLRWQKAILAQVREDVAAGKPPRFAVFGQDTVTALGGLAYNATLVTTGRDRPPPAQSPDGNVFYSLIKQKLDELFHVPRSLKGLGVHWISLGHVTEKDSKDTNVATAPDGTTIKVVVPNLPGSYKDILPSYFDVVLHAGVDKGKHVLRWKPSQRRPTKSRFVDLSKDPVIENNFAKLNAMIDEAIAREESR